MAPHCDTLDGPVVKAARKALETGNVNLILPWVSKEGETEVKELFEKALGVRAVGGQAAELADLWFFENVVRVHRAGEGAPYTGMKPAGLDWGPVVPRAEKAIAEGNADEVIGFVTGVVQDELRERFESAEAHKGYDENDVPAAREYVQAELGFVLFSHHLYSYVKSGGGHGGEGDREQGE
jgi:hypothetical protein